ncbi:MAG: peptidoglycan editing factor PgeF [Clostridia bacterium]|nr:peptidoglycan editing factor PgeF [Clostridia bacterium]
MTDFYTKNGVVFCRALDEIPFIGHGFSTRCGGVSELEYTKSMNLAYCRGDDDQTVFTNRHIFAASAGFDAGGLVLGEQTHSDNVAVADGSKKYFANTDGFVSATPGVFAAAKTADCQPVLFADPENRVVGVCHAGWRGTMKKIAAKTVSLMIKNGAKADKIIAALGPCIKPCCFEVKEDFVAEFERNAPELLCFIKKENGVYHADISGMNRAVLLSAGLLDKNIYICDECTCHNADKYFSHRRQGALRGTMLSVIGIKKLAEQI